MRPCPSRRASCFTGTHLSILVTSFRIASILMPFPYNLSIHVALIVPQFALLVLFLWQHLLSPHHSMFLLMSGPPSPSGLCISALLVPPPSQDGTGGLRVGHEGGGPHGGKATYVVQPFLACPTGLISVWHGLEAHVGPFQRALEAVLWWGPGRGLCHMHTPLALCPGRSARVLQQPHRPHHRTGPIIAP